MTRELGGDQITVVAIAVATDSEKPFADLRVLARVGTTEWSVHCLCQGGLEEVMMRTFSSILLTGAIGLSLNFGVASAAPKDKAAKITGQTMTVTGCLTQEPKEKNEYLITGEDGKIWGLKSHTVKLEEHLNHKITVTGKVTKGGHEKEAGDLDVSNLQMVSQTCQ